MQHQGREGKKLPPPRAEEEFVFTSRAATGGRSRAAGGAEPAAGAEAQGRHFVMVHDANLVGKEGPRRDTGESGG